MVAITPPRHKRTPSRRTRRARFTAGRLIAALVLCGCLAEATSQLSGAAGDPLVRAGTLAPQAAPSGSVALGSLGSDQDLSLTVVLAPSHPDQLHSLLADLYNPRSPDFHHWLAPGRFQASFGPTPSQVSAVETWLHGAGLTATTVSGFTVKVRATTRGISSALGVSFKRYRTRGGTTGYVGHGAPLVPASLAGGEIRGILGLDTLAQMVPEIGGGAGGGAGEHAAVSSASASPHLAHVAHADGLAPCADATTAAGSSYYTLDQLGAAYGIDSLLTAGQTGRGVTIGMYELAPHLTSDLNTYETCFGLTNSITTVPVDGGGTTGVSGTVEADLDIEQAATQAPGASIISYEGPNTGSGQYDTWNTIVSADVAQVVSTSWGICEPMTGQTFSTLFMEAAMQGQTVLAASGDAGSEGCYSDANNDFVTTPQVDYPASDPWVTAVGGTSLFGTGDEVAWNDCQTDESTSCANTPGTGAAGGGLSRLEAKPSFQPEVLTWPTSQTCGTVCREVPDLSANAGVGMVVYAYENGNGGWIAAHGTSFSAPFIAGLVADKDEGCTAPTGDMAPALYGLSTEGGYGTAFTDITSGAGNTDYTGSNSGDYPTASGYDLATGLGSPIADGLSCSEVTSVQPTSATPGTDVTLTGLGLEAAAVFFGSRQAQVVSASATTATVVVPSGGGSVSVSATTVQGNGTATAAFDVIGPPAPPPSGYDLVGQDGGVFVFPTGQSGGFYGSLPGLGVHVSDIVGMVPSPDDKGYFLVGQDGGVFAFGDAPFLGSLPGLKVSVHDIKGIVPTSDNRGYFLVGQDGGVFAFGDAPFLGSLPGEGIHINDVIGIAATPSDKGYWVVAGNGTVYGFGNAPAYGSATGTPSPVSGITSTPDGGGYWIVTQNGGVYTFGDAGAYGSLPGIGVKPSRPVIGLVPTSDQHGYWLIGGDGGIFAFGDAPFVGSLPGLGIHITDIVGAVPTTP